MLAGIRTNLLNDEFSSLTRIKAAERLTTGIELVQHFRELLSLHQKKVLQDARRCLDRHLSITVDDDLSHPFRIKLSSLRSGTGRHALHDEKSVDTLLIEKVDGV